MSGLVLEQAVGIGLKTDHQMGGECAERATLAIIVLEISHILRKRRAGIVESGEFP